MQDDSRCSFPEWILSSHFCQLTSRQEQFEALAILCQQAINEEEKIKMMCKIVADNNSSSSSHSNSSYHIPIYKATVKDATSEDYLSAAVDAANCVVIVTTDDNHLQHQAVQDIYDSDPTSHVLNSFANSLSPVENAICKASGLDRPKIALVVDNLTTTLRTVHQKTTLMPLLEL
jgi:type IV secretory pathway TrbF-like protein